MESSHLKIVAVTSYSMRPVWEVHRLSVCCVLSVIIMLPNVNVSPQVTRDAIYLSYVAYQCQAMQVVASHLMTDEHQRRLGQ